MISLNPQEYLPQISIDCVVFGYQAQQIKVLITKLDFDVEFWALPGGFIRQEEAIEQAAARILFRRTGLKEIYLEQFYVFGSADRNNKAVMDQLFSQYLKEPEKERDKRDSYNFLTQRFISIGFYALVNIQKVMPKPGEMDKQVEWANLNELPPMIIDHSEIVDKAVQSLRKDLDNKLSAFELLPETFTMRELQELYEAIFSKTFLRANFQKKMLSLNVLDRLEKKYTGAANKAPYLYRFKK